MQPPVRPGAVFQALGRDDPPLVGGYRVLASIGAGRTGRVLLAATQSGRTLAVKVAAGPYARDEAFRARFKREVADAQRARGRYLARVVDGHAEGELPWVAAEYVPGPTLKDAVAEAGPLPVPAARALAGALAEALASLHEAGLVHGALRPSNVLLAGDGPRLVDFASREGPSDAAGDVFMLGLVVLHAATGDPFPGRVPEETPDLAGCPGELRGLVERCLAGHGERPEATAIAAELEEAPGPGWLPPEFAELLPAYAADPEPVQARGHSPAPVPAAEPVQEFAPGKVVLAKPGAPEPAATRPDARASGTPESGTPESVDGRSEPPRTRPNFVAPPPHSPQVPAGGPPLTAPPAPPVMGSYRHDLAIALGIGGAAFGILVLVLLIVFIL